MNKTENIRLQLSKSLNSQNKDYARMVKDDQSSLTQYPTPFFQNFQIYEVYYFNPRRPIVFFVAYHPNGKNYLLTNKEEAFLQLSKKESVQLNEATEALNYVKAFLETTRSMSRLFYIINTVDDIKFRPNLSEEDEKLKSDFIEQFGPMINKTAAKKTGEGYAISLYTISGNSLEKQNFMVTEDGLIKRQSTEIVNNNLPLVYGL